MPNPGGYALGIGYQAFLAKIGGTEGFRGPIKSAIASYIAENGSAADPEPLKAEIRAAIARADAGGRSLSELERYTSDKHLDGIFDWVRAHHGDQPPRPKPVPPDSGALDKLVVEFNAKFAVFNEAGKAVIYRQQVDPVLDRSVLVRIEFTDLKKLYMNQRVPILSPDGETVMKSAAELWLVSKKRRQYLEGVVFDPTREAPPSYWNLYTGFGVAPTPGDWSLMRQHIREVICAGEREYYAYLINWAARMVQFPAEPGEVAVVMRGEEGVGKGILARYLIRCLGQHGIHVSSAEHLVGNFNAHLRGAIFLFADEAFFAGDKKHEGRLKALITDSFFTVEGKYRVRGHGQKHAAHHYGIEFRLGHPSEPEGPAMVYARCARHAPRRSRLLPQDCGANGQWRPPCHALRFVASGHLRIRSA